MAFAIHCPPSWGCSWGHGAQIIVVGIGLGALLAASTTAFQIVKWLGIAYLVWLWLQKWTQAPLTVDGVAQLDDGPDPILAGRFRQSDQPEGDGVSGRPLPAVSEHQKQTRQASLQSWEARLFWLTSA